MPSSGHAPEAMRHTLTMLMAATLLSGSVICQANAQDSLENGERIVNPVAEFTGLDKITGRVITFDVLIDETVQFGALQVTPRRCYSRPPTEPPRTTVFVEVDEVTLENEIRRIFNGWMFADSPGLNAVEHPIYDVWLTNCKTESDEVDVGSR